MNSAKSIYTRVGKIRAFISENYVAYGNKKEVGHMKGKRICLAIALLVLTMLVGGCGTQGTGNESSSQVTSWSIVSSGSGSSPYMMTSIMSNIINEHANNLRVSSQVSAGFEENIKLVGEGNAELGIVSSNLMGKAQEAYPDLHALFNAFSSPIHVVVDGEIGASRIEDLKGKTVNIGAPGQATRTITEKLLAAYGLSLEDIKVSSLTTGEGIAALQDGQIDAAVIVGNLPIPGISELAVSKKVDLLPIDGLEAQEFNKNLGLILSKAVIPAGTYQNVDYDTNTMSASVAVVGDKGLDEGLVYEFTKAFWDSLDELQESHAGFKSVSRESAISGWNMPLHPGAAKYFQTP